MNSYYNPYYRSLLGVSTIDNVNASQINTQNLTISSLGTGLVSSSSGNIQNAVIGTGLNFAGNTISNSGVTLLTGTSNQVLASASTGSVTLSLPQSIATTSSPAFAGLTIGTLSGILKATTGLISGSSTTDDLPEGASNQYFTTSRARNAFTATLPISILSGLISLGYNTGNLKITASQLNTIQDISTSSSPIFSRIANSSISSSNVLIGNNTGAAITTSQFNTAVGSGALQSIITTGSNIAVGYQALNQCVGSSNTSLGQTAGYSVTSGGNNVFCGWQAGRGGNPLTTGNYCTYLGSSSFPSGGGVNGEVVIGNGIGSGSNTCTIYAGSGVYFSNLTTGLLKSTSGLIGQAASSDFVASITGTANQVVASSSTGAITLSLPQSIGTSSSPQFSRLLNSSIGLTNVLIGTGSGTSITSGGGNTIVGSNAGSCITSGTFNVALGAGCLGGSGGMTTIDAVNVAIGKNALYSCATTATDNFAVGYNALQSVTTGSGNIAIGYSMASTLTTGSNNIYLGHGTTPSSVSVSDEGVLNVSATNVTGKGANTMFINATAGVYSYVPAYYFGYFSSASGGNFTPTSLSSRGITTNTNLITLPYIGTYEIILSGTVITSSVPFAIYHYVAGVLYPYAGINNQYYGSVIGYLPVSYTSFVTTTTVNTTTNFTYYTPSFGSINTAAPTFITIKYIGL